MTPSIGQTEPKGFFERASDFFENSIANPLRKITASFPNPTNAVKQASYRANLGTLFTKASISSLVQMSFAGCYVLESKTVVAHLSTTQDLPRRCYLAFAHGILEDGVKAKTADTIFFCQKKINMGHFYEMYDALTALGISPLMDYDPDLCAQTCSKIIKNITETDVAEYLSNQEMFYAPYGVAAAGITDGIIDTLADNSQLQKLGLSRKIAVITREALKLMISVPLCISLSALPGLESVNAYLAYRTAFAVSKVAVWAITKAVNYYLPSRTVSTVLKMKTPIPIPKIKQVTVQEADSGAQRRTTGFWLSEYIKEEEERG